jgi:hypothetical protein
MSTSAEWTTVRIDRETAAALEARAAARGLSLETYLRVIAGCVGGGAARPYPGAAADEFDKAMDKYFRQHPGKLPPLPWHFTRPDVYHDRD